jgi:hypothetical protein
VVKAADRAKSDLYLDFLPLLNSGSAELLDLPRLIAQLTSLERRTHRGGRDNVDHGPGGGERPQSRPSGQSSASVRRWPIRRPRA